MNACTQRSYLALAALAVGALCIIAFGIVRIWRLERAQARWQDDLDV